MAHTNISAISRRYDNNFAAVVLTWAARARAVDVSLSGQGGLITVWVHSCVSAAVQPQALFQISWHTTVHTILSLYSLFIDSDMLQYVYITFQPWNITSLPLVLLRYSNS